MTEEQYLLTVLGEECAEVAHRTSKAIRFTMEEVQPGQQVSNRERIEGELSDLMAVAGMLGLEVSADLMAAKEKKVRKYMDYSRERGVLDREDHDGPGQGTRGETDE